MRIFDATISSDSISNDDLNNLRYFGTTHVLSVTEGRHLGETSDDVVNYFQTFVDRERERLESLDLRCAVALGIAGSPPRRVHSEIFARLQVIAANPAVVAIGHIGVDDDLDRQWRFFDEQLRVAQETELPIVVSTRSPLTATRVYAMMERIVRHGFEPARALFFATDEKVVEPIVTEGFHAALSLRTGHFTSAHAAAIACQFAAFESQLVLCSGLQKDCGDVLALPKVVMALGERHCSRETIEALMFGNAANFFKFHASE